MRCTVAAVGIWLVGCSVYDDELLATRSAITPAAVTPAPAGSPGAPVLQPRFDAAAPGDAAAPRGAAAPSDTACAHGVASDYCAQLPALGVPPAIDGALECGLSLSPIQPLGWQGPSPAPNKRASFAAAWHREGLYVFVEVRGGPVVPHPPTEPVFCGDAVELYVDADAEVDDGGAYDATGTMQFVVSAPRPDAAEAEVDAWRFTEGVSQGAWISNSVRVSPLADGYSVEAFITGADLGLWQWTPSVRLGFSLAIDLAGAQRDGGPSSSKGCSAEFGQFFLRLGEPRGACPGEPWCDATAFCAAELLE